MLSMATAKVSNPSICLGPKTYTLYMDETNVRTVNVYRHLQQYFSYIVGEVLTYLVQPSILSRSCARDLYYLWFVTVIWKTIP